METENYCFSETSTYRILKSYDLITAGPCRRAGGRRVPGKDDATEPDLANRLHLSQGHRLGTTSFINNPGR